MLQLFLYKPLRNKISSQTTCGACCTPSSAHAHHQQQHEHEPKQDEKQHLTSPVTLLCVFCSFSMSCFACYMCYAECTVRVDSIGSAANRSQNRITSHRYVYCYVSAAVLCVCCIAFHHCTCLIALSIGSQLHHRQLYDLWLCFVVVNVEREFHCSLWCRCKPKQNNSPKKLNNTPQHKQKHTHKHTPSRMIFTRH